MSHKSLFEYIIIQEEGRLSFNYKKHYKIQVAFVKNKIYWYIINGVYLIKKGINNDTDYHLTYYIKFGILDCIKHEREVNEI